LEVPRESLDSNKALEAEEFLEYLKDCELLREDSAPKCRTLFILYPAEIKKSTKINIKFFRNRHYLSLIREKD